MAGGVPELEKSAEMVGDDLEGVDEDKSNGAGPWDDVQGIGTDSSAVPHIKLGGDGIYVDYPGGVSPPGGHTDCRYDGNIVADGTWEYPSVVAALEAAV